MVESVMDEIEDVLDMAGGNLCLLCFFLRCLACIRETLLLPESNKKIYIPILCNTKKIDFFLLKIKNIGIYKEKVVYIVCIFI